MHDALRPLAAFLPLALAACAPDPGTGNAGLVACLAAASDFAPIAPTTVFPAGGRWLGATFVLDDGEQASSLVQTWTALDVGDAAPPGQQIARSVLPLEGRRAGRLSYEQDVPLPLGRYRVDAALDGRPWRSLELQVAADPPQPRLAAPRELLPLVPGVHWEYDFASLGPGGKRASHRVRVEVGDAEADGTRVRFLRDGALVHEEWWRFADEGLLAARRATGGGEVVLDPPQLLLPFPPGPLRRWEYVSRDGSVRLSCCCFGPRPVRGPEGEAPGFVAVVVDRGGPEEVSSERHFLPGYGLVFESIVYSRGGERRLEQRMTVRPAGAK